MKDCPSHRARIVEALKGEGKEKKQRKTARPAQGGAQRRLPPKLIWTAPGYRQSFDLSMPMTSLDTDSVNRVESSRHHMESHTFYCLIPVSPDVSRFRREHA